MKHIIAMTIALLLTGTAMAETRIPDSGTLIIFILSVESSYAQNIERPATVRFDTLQWWIGEKNAWRIKTYAIDSDIHPYLIKTRDSREELRKLAMESTKKHYGDVIRQVIMINVPGGATQAEVASLLIKNNLNDRFEWVEPGYLLWLPDESEYKSKTAPK